MWHKLKREERGASSSARIERHIARIRRPENFCHGRVLATHPAHRSPGFSPLALARSIGLGARGDELATHRARRSPRISPLALARPVDRLAALSPTLAARPARVALSVQSNSGHVRRVSRSRFSRARSTSGACRALVFSRRIRDIMQVLPAAVGRSARALFGAARAQRMPPSRLSEDMSPTRSAPHRLRTRPAPVLGEMAPLPEPHAMVLELLRCSVARELASETANVGAVCRSRSRRNAREVRSDELVAHQPRVARLSHRRRRGPSSGAWSMCSRRSVRRAACICRVSLAGSIDELVAHPPGCRSQRIGRAGLAPLSR